MGMSDLDRTVTAYNIQDEPACDPRKSHKQPTNATSWQKVVAAFEGAYAPAMA